MHAALHSSYFLSQIEQKRDAKLTLLLKTLKNCIVFEKEISLLFLSLAYLFVLFDSVRSVDEQQEFCDHVLLTHAIIHATINITSDCANIAFED